MTCPLSTPWRGVVAVLAIAGASTSYSRVLEPLRVGEEHPWSFAWLSLCNSVSNEADQLTDAGNQYDERDRADMEGLLLAMTLR